MLAIAGFSMAFASSAPISAKDTDNILTPRNYELSQKTTQNAKKVQNYSTPEVVKNYYVSKDEDKKNDEKLVFFKRDSKDKDTKQNIELKGTDSGIISQSQRRISAIYPLDDVSATNTYPGYRGPNQLVVYYHNFGRTTETNEFGKEAVVINNTVVRLTGANSSIPRNGFVISGHGSAKKWISDNLKIGTKIEIDNRTIKAYTTVDSYRYQAKSKIDEVENILVSTKSDYQSRDDKYIYYYLKKAKQQYKKSTRQDNEDSVKCAKEAIENASMAFQYTLPYVSNELKGVWIRPKEHSVQEVQRTLDLIKDTGINNVFLETYFHGMTIFPSRVMQEYGFISQYPEFSNFDALAVWIKEAHRRNIKIHVWFQSFYVGNKPPQSNPRSILAMKPDWQNKTKQKADVEGYVSHPQEHNGYFLDPANPEVTEFLFKLIGEISARYNIDGFNIDYVRYPNIAKENFSNQWGYTKFARQEFLRTFDVDPININSKGSMWNSWCEYRQDKITSYVRKVSELLNNRNIMFSAVIFPDYKVALLTKHQDWTRWADKGYVSALTPLILTSDDELAKNMLEEIKKKSGSAEVYPGLFAGFIESDPEDLLRQIHIVRKLKLQGIILFDWAHLNENYLKVLKTSAFKAQTY